MSRKSSSRSPPAPTGRRQSAGGESASTRIWEIFRNLGDRHFKVLSINVDGDGSIFLSARERFNDDEEWNSINFRLSEAEAADLIMKLNGALLLKLLLAQTTLKAITEVEKP